MIKTDLLQGIVEIRGEEAMILTELSKIVKELYNNGTRKESLERAFRHAFMSEEELKKELLEKMQDVGIDDNLIKSLKNFFDKEDK